MWSGKKCSLYRVHKVLYTEFQSWPWPLIPWPKINRVPLLIIHNWNVKFESDQEKKCSLYRVHKVLYTEFQSWPWPLIPWPKINRGFPLVIHKWHVKFESDGTKRVFCIVSTRQSAMDALTDSLTQPHMNSRIIISPPTLLPGDN